MSKLSRSFFRILFLAFIVLGALVGYWAYMNLYKPNVNLEGKNYKFVFIKTGAGIDDVYGELYDENVIENHQTFEWMAQKLDLDKNIHPGKYRIIKGMNNRQ